MKLHLLFLALCPMLSARPLLAAAPLQPLVEVDTGYLLGAVANGKCVKHERAARALTGREKYRVYGLTERLGEATGSKPESPGEACADVSIVNLTPEPERGAIALAAPWNALPRVPKILSPTEPIHIDAVRSFLEERGLEKPEVKITQILRVDLDGDGEDEVLISATNYFTKEGSSDEPPAGSYSCVLLRQVIAGAVKTKLIEGEFRPKAGAGPKDQHGAASTYKVSAVLDIDGDGKMEVIVKAAYYEGGWTTIYRCSRKRIEKLLYVFCGL